MNEEKLNKKTIKKEIKTIQKRMITWDQKRLYLFIFDVLVFLVVFILFLISWLDEYITENYEEYRYFSYTIFFGSLYILIKYPSTLFFFTGTYYKKIIIYNKTIKIDKNQLIFKREVYYNSINFMIIYIIMNTIIAVILNDESKEYFQDNSVVTALITTASLLLLTPSFVASLNNIFKLKKNLSSQYKLLLRNQFLANIDLFKDYLPINNFEAIKLKYLNVKSKRGTFLLVNYEDVKIQQEILAHNLEIIKLYHDLWHVYCSYLFLLSSIDNVIKVNKYTDFHIQNFFDSIFDDFFDL